MNRLLLGLCMLMALPLWGAFQYETSEIVGKDENLVSNVAFSSDGNAATADGSENSDAALQIGSWMRSTLSRVFSSAPVLSGTFSALNHLQRNGSFVPGLQSENLDFAVSFGAPGQPLPGVVVTLLLGGGALYAVRRKKRQA